MRRAQVIVRQAEAATSSPMLLRTPTALMASSITTSMARSDVYENLARKTKLQRTWGDCYGYVLVATGRAEVMLDSAIKPWDIAPMLPILQEAGGQFTD